MSCFGLQVTLPIDFKARVDVSPAHFTAILASFLGSDATPVFFSQIGVYTLQACNCSWLDTLMSLILYQQERPGSVIWTQAFFSKLLLD